MNIYFKNSFEDTYGVSPASLNTPLRNSDSAFNGIVMNQYTVSDKKGDTWTVQSYGSYEEVIEDITGILI